MSDFLLGSGQTIGHTKGEVVSLETQNLESQFLEWKNSIPMNLAGHLPENISKGIPAFSVKKTDEKAFPGKILVLEVTGKPGHVLGLDINEKPLELLFIGKELPLCGVLPCNQIGHQLFGKKAGDKISITDPRDKKKRDQIEISVKEIRSPNSEYLERIIGQKST
jgi:hypothetical protein